tara:strand:- start:8531 stop:9499 length:969 start_codon:yes stop_codon:yes gene_type:complete
MSSKIRWSLPDGVDELLPPKAIEVEKLRRDLIDKYVSLGYDFIIPPILELSETIGGVAHDEIKSHAFTFKDNLTGKNLSIRPDISEQASRIDAYRIQSDEIVRLCYSGEVVKSKASKVLRSRTTIQAGAEIFGDSSRESELESIRLMLDSLAITGIKEITLSIGHAGFTASVLEPFKQLGSDLFSNIEAAVSRKSKSDLMSLIPEAFERKKHLINLCDMYGGRNILEEAKRAFSYIDNVSDYIENIDYIAKEIVKDRDLEIHIDLGEIQGFKYHNGIVFSAYSGKAGYVLAKGGRYDGLRRSSEKDRPAVGFDLDLIAVSNL